MHAESQMGGRKVSELETALNEEGIKERTRQLSWLARLSHGVVLNPRADAANGLAPELHGELAEILISEARAKRRRSVL